MSMHFFILHYYCCSVTKSCSTLCNTMVTHQAPLSFTISQSLLRLISIELVIPPNYLILCYPIILPSIFPAWGSFPMSQLFTPGGQSIGASASVLPVNIQGWIPLGLTVKSQLTWLEHAAATASKSLQLCPTLCDPIDGSPPGSAVPGILQARTLEWVAISISNAWKWKVKVKSLSCVQLLATPWTAAYQAPPSMGFSRQEYWSGVPLPSTIY